MRLAGVSAGVWMMVAGLAAAGSRAEAQPDAPQPQQQTSLPSAPKPQTLPDLNTITPVAPAVSAPMPSADAGTQTSAPAPAAADDDGPPPAAHLSDAAKIEKADADAADTVGSAGTIHVRVNYVDVPFTVKDSKGHLVPGLTYRDVRVYENGVRQHPLMFSTDSAPLSVALIIDQSVTFDTMNKINASLAALQAAFTPYDEVAVFTYNNGVTMRDGFSSAQGARLGVILDRSKIRGRDPIMGTGGPISQTLVKNNQSVDPNTTAVRGQQGLAVTVPRELHTLNDAILQAGQLLATADRGRRRVIFVIGEGKEYGSKAKEKDVIHFLQQQKVAVYATLVGDSAIPGFGFMDRIHLPLTMRDDILPRYAAATGGECDPEWRPNGIQQSFSRISETVRTQYTIGYNSSEPAVDGKFRKVEVRIMRPDLTVVAKQGYYPNPQDSVPAGSKPHQAVPLNSSPFPVEK